MAEGKSGPKSPGVPDGWESDSSPEDYRNFSTSGRGATTADPGKPEIDDAPLPGKTQPEFPPEGWGQAGENYPPTRGPVPERGGDRGGGDRGGGDQRGEESDDR